MQPTPPLTVMESPPLAHLQSRDFDPNIYTTVNWEVYFSLPPAEAEYQLAHVGQSRAGLMMALMYGGVTLGLVAVLLRFISRRISKTSLQADDWTILASWIFFNGLAVALSLDIIRYGAGRHAICLTDPFAFGKSAVAIQALYPLAMAFIKISTLLLYLRIFPGGQFRLWLWSAGLFVAIYTGIQVLGSIFQCRPIRKAWDPLVEGQCIQVDLLYLTCGGMNPLTDIMILIAPMPTLWRLQMGFNQKIQLMSIFCVGGFVCVVSIIRLPKLKNISVVDAPRSDSLPVIWSIIELSIALLCSCAITYRPLFAWIFKLGHNSSMGSGYFDKTTTSKTKNSSLTSNRKAWKGINDEDQIKMVDVQVSVHSVHARDGEGLGSAG